jgi:hypothetical protein
MPWADGDDLTPTNLNNTVPTWHAAGAGGAGAAVRYVKTAADGGDDNNDGLDWITAKATIGGAVTSLTAVGSGGQVRNAGTIYVGEGTFTEGNVDIRSDIHILGQGTGQISPQTATHIKLADETNDHFFSPGAAFTDSAHHFQIENCLLDGNKANQSGTNVVSGVNITFANDDPDTIERASGSWVDDSYAAGDLVLVAGSTSNDGYYFVASVAADKLTLVSDETLTAEGPASGITVGRVNFDLVRLRHGGFNCNLRNVAFKNASRFAISAIETIVTLGLDNVTGANCEGGFFHVENVTATNLLEFNGRNLQIDNCGPAPFFVVDNANGGLNVFIVDGCECESLSDARSHRDIVRYEPKAGTNGMGFFLNSIHAFSDSANRDYLVHELAGSGAGGSFHMVNCHGDSDYTAAFRSDKQGYSSVDAHVYGFATFGRFAQTRWEFHDTQETVNSGAPESSVIAPVGSIYRRRDGAGGRTLYVKEGGTGNTNWGAVFTSQKHTAASGPVGSVTGKVEVYDAAGASLGFLVVYDGIT